VVVAICGSFGRAAADDSNQDDVHVGAIVAEMAVVFAIPTAYYWSTTEHQAVDWTLDWDWDSWKAKLLTIDKLKFDTNPFHVNALRHPLVGVLDYQIGRSNGLGGLESMWFAFATGAAWEFFIEYREAPSVNDRVANGVGGIAIGEPLYRIGQLWRGSTPSLLDRARTTLFSPWDAMHDLYRKRRARVPAWRSILLDAGSGVRWHAGSADAELTLAADFDVVSHAPFVTGGVQAGPIATGAWSRLRAELGVADHGDGARLTHTLLHTRTTFFGKYEQSEDGAGYLAALGTAFTYRYDRFAQDRLGLFHLLGPQLQITRRHAERAIWIDVAAYGNFALVDPVATLGDYPEPPPYFSSIQGDGYYYGVGFSAMARLRAAYGPWAFDIELAAHQAWQIESHIVHNVELADGYDDVTAFDLSDTRVFGRAKAGFRHGTWGIAATADGAYRRGKWQRHDDDLGDVACGLVLELDY
jgi:hypothetical protein